MSYLGSLLASYGVGEENAKHPAREPSRPVMQRDSTVIPSSILPSPSAGSKRKAEDAMPGQSAKVLKSESAAVIATKDTSGSSSASAQRGQNHSTRVRPASSTGRQNGDTASAKVRAAPAAVATTAPPKGSFAELMARAKVIQQSKLGQGTKIMHKATPKDYPRDRKKETDPKARSKNIKGLSVSRSGSEGPSKAVKPDPTKPINKSAKAVLGKSKRKPIEVSYKGTMRPNMAAQTVYRGTVNSTATTNWSRPNDLARDRYGGRYRNHEDEAEDDDDEAEYDSAASSDMEAGAWDIDEEEDFALRNAKAEDAAAKREEEEHKRKKLLLKQGMSPGSARRRY